jgi:hypothetical protein
VASLTSPTKCEPPRTAIPGRLSYFFNAAKKDLNNAFLQEKL